MQILILKLIVAALVGTLVFTAGYATRKFTYPTRLSHSDVRLAAIVSQAHQEAQAEVLLLGTSIIEFARVNSLCDKSVLNAGIAGSTSRDVKNVSAALRFLSPKIVVLEIGINDAIKGNLVPKSEFAANISEVIDHWQRHGAKVFLVPISPISLIQGLGPRFDPSHITALNKELAAIAARFSVQTAANLENSAFTNGSLADDNTSDGVHLSEIGYRRWKQAIQNLFNECRQN